MLNVVRFDSRSWLRMLLLSKPFFYWNKAVALVKCAASAGKWDIGASHYLSQSLHDPRWPLEHSGLDGIQLGEKKCRRRNIGKNHAATKPQQRARFKRIKNMLQDFRDSLRIHVKLKPNMSFCCCMEHHSLFLILHSLFLILHSLFLIQNLFTLLHIRFMSIAITCKWLYSKLNLFPRS